MPRRKSKHKKAASRKTRSYSHKSGSGQVQRDLEADVQWLISPKTGRKIKHGGPTHVELMKHPKWGPMLKEVKMQPGSSNAVRHAEEGLSESQFCGSFGGSAPTSFPVNTPGRCRSALARAHFAPNPDGIRKCVYEKCNMHPKPKSGSRK